MVLSRLAVPILLLYVFFRDFRPSEPFLTPFLNESKNFTKHEINNMIYPVWSYSQLPIFILVLVTTDIVRYRPMIWLGAMGYVSTWLLLVYGKTVQQMQLMQVTYAIGTACEVAYKSYVFVAVTKERYSTVSFYLAGATLLGRSMSSFASQILHDHAEISFLQLHYISLASVSLALLLALLIPAPQFSIGLNDGSAIQPSASDQDKLIVDENISHVQKVKEGLQRGKTNIFLSYKSVQTRRWAYWAIVSSALYFMVGNSSQSLWKDLEHDKKKRYNGYVVGVTGLLSSFSSWVLTRYSYSVERTKATVLALLTLAIALTTLLPTIIQNLYLAYVCDAVFNIITSCCMTISLFKIAHSLTTNLYGFVVGVNACIAGTLDLLVTFIVIDERVLSFNPRQQYWVYTGFAVLCVLLYFAYKCVVLARRDSATEAPRSRAVSFAENEAADIRRKELGGFVGGNLSDDDDNILDA